MHRYPLALLVAFAALVGLSMSGSAQEKKLLAAKGWGSLSGTVTLEGAIPAPVNLVPQINKKDDKACCLAAPANQKLDPAWVVDANSKGVANVIVWIKPPAGAYFPIHNDDKARKKPVVIDQPFCAFVPHVAAVFPSYFDGTRQTPTGEKLVLKNSSKTPHNVRGTTNPLINRLFNQNMPPDTELEFTFKPQPLPIMVQCDFHPWMRSYVFVADHPYVAITGNDGKFKMPRVPAGAEVTIMAWHGVEGLNALAIEGKALTIKEGENTFDFSFKAK